MSRILAGVIFLIGLWLFLAPFIGPAIGLPLAPASMGGMSHMGMRMGNMPTVTVNRAMVFVNFIPAVILMMAGLYELFRSRPAAAAD